MAQDLRFFCDATYTLKKKVTYLGFLKKEPSYAFFVARPTLFLTRNLLQKELRFSRGGGGSPGPGPPPLPGDWEESAGPSVPKAP